MTEQGTVLGTIPYMAPEQVEGREADARTDVFALGVMLYEMTSGRPPFEGRSPASVMASILTHDPQPLSSARPGVPASVDRVVKKCLAKDPDERWQSAADLNAALQWSRDDSAPPHGPPHAIDNADTSPAGCSPRSLMVAAVAAPAMWILTGRVASGTGAAAAAVHSGHLPDRHRVRRSFRAGRRDHHLQCGVGRRPYALFMTRRGSPESRPLNIPDARLLGVSSTGDLAFLRGSHDAVRLLAPPGTGTLARVAMTGGGPREILDDVVAADWAPGGEFAVVRRDRVEFPLGTTIHGPHQFRYVRIAPDGQRLALADGRNVVVLDRSGNKTTLSSGWGELTHASRGLPRATRCGSPRSPGQTIVRPGRYARSRSPGRSGSSSTLPAPRWPFWTCSATAAP